MNSKLAILTLLAFTFSPLAAPAAVTITGSDETAGQTITQMPGSATDFIFIRDVDASTDFSTDLLGNPVFSPYSTLVDPAGNTEGTGIVFNHLADHVLFNLATFTLGTGSPTFNYSDFNVYVLYDNTTGDPNSIDAAISLAAGDDATGASATVVDVSDPADKSIPGIGRIVTFNVQGLSAGDQFTIAASAVQTNNNTVYFGAVSLESAPEPSTYAMVAGGLVLLGLALRRSRRLARG